MTSAEPQQPAAKVLVIAADPSIEALLGELIAFAGHRPVFDATSGAAGEAVRLLRPDFAFVDAALGAAVASSCVAACAEVGSRPVLVSSTSSEQELVAEASRRGCRHFALPGSPSALGALIQSDLGAGHRPAISRLNGAHARPGTNGRPRGAGTARNDMAPPGASARPAICAAMVSIAHAQVVARRARSALRATRMLRAEVRDSIAEARRHRAALRAAIADYARQLRASDIPREEMLELVRQTLAECAVSVGAQDALGYLLDETRHWAMEAYSAA